MSWADTQAVLLAAAATIVVVRAATALPVNRPVLIPARVRRRNIPKD